MEMVAVVYQSKDSWQLKVEQLIVLRNLLKLLENLKIMYCPVF